jgi:hypothetical protein
MTMLSSSAAVTKGTTTDAASPVTTGTAAEVSKASTTTAASPVMAGALASTTSTSYAGAAANVTAALGTPGDIWIGLTDSGGTEVSGPGYARVPVVSNYTVSDTIGDSSYAVAGWYAPDPFTAVGGDWTGDADRWQAYTSLAGPGDEYLVAGNLIGDNIGIGAVLDGQSIYNTAIVLVMADALTETVVGSTYSTFNAYCAGLSLSPATARYLALLDETGTEVAAGSYARKAFSFEAPLGVANSLSAESAGVLVDWSADRGTDDWGTILTVVVTDHLTDPLTYDFEWNLADYLVRLGPTDEGFAFTTPTVVASANYSSVIYFPSISFPTSGVGWVGGPPDADAKATLDANVTGWWAALLTSSNVECTGTGYARVQPVWDPSVVDGDPRRLTINGVATFGSAGGPWGVAGKIAMFNAPSGGSYIRAFDEPTGTRIRIALANPTTDPPYVEVPFIIDAERPSGGSLQIQFQTPPTALFVSPLTGPTITAPADASSHPVGMNVTFSATPDTTADEIQFFVNDVLIQTDSSDPYEATWMPTVAGTYTLRARTYLGGIYADSTEITVTATGAAVSLVTPAGGWTHQQYEWVVLGANANHSLTITSVEFFLDGDSIGTVTKFPHSLRFQTAIAFATYDLQAIAHSVDGDSYSDIQTLTITEYVAPSAPGGWGRQAD